ncbi:MAG: hypothetical protein ACHQYQ_04060, partial [Bacteriovoracales bacterium]
KDIITLDNVTLVSHDAKTGGLIDPPNRINTVNGVVFSAVINGVTKYFGAATDWAAQWDSIKNLSDAQKDHVLTLFFQGQFDTLGFLKPTAFTIPDPNVVGGTIAMVKYEVIKNPGTYFSQSSDTIKDVEALGANIESSRFENLAENLESNYGLSEERAQAVAKNLSAYQRLSSKRSLTEKERNFFSNEVLGVSFKDAKNALTSGNTEDLNKLLESAALKNGTSPEQVSSILNEIFL